MLQPEVSLGLSTALKAFRALAPGVCFFALSSATFVHAATTLNHIRQTQTLRCATIAETPEYSSTDDHGPRTAFDADICRAVAIAILGPNARTVTTSYPDDIAAMAALRASKVDLIPTLTLDLTHSSNHAISFSPPILYDAVGFLVPNSPALTHAADLSGKKICFLGETEVESSLRAWFARQHLDFLPFPFNEEGEMEAAFVSGNCAALAGDLTRLASIRISFGPLASHYAFVPDPTSGNPANVAPDPLAAAARSDDPAYAGIVTWTLEVLLNAEAAGITQSSATTSLLSSHIAPLLPSRGGADGSASLTEDPTLAILTGRTHEIGARLNLRNTWALEVLAATGNYAEIFKRDLGSQSPLKLPRAQNRISTSGGLMFPLPLK